jgi:glutamate transport system permease protein
MNEIIGVLPALLRAFAVTLELAALSALLSLALGIATATMYISPVPPLRWLCGLYIRFVRNTPITIVFFLTVFGLPQVGISLSFFNFALLALTLYTATFIAETIRAGVLAIPIGQVEAARSIGLTFTQVVGSVVLPQALRSVVPPLASIFIALLKNTSVASAFGLGEAVSTMTNLVNVHSTAVLEIMVLTAAIYISLALLLGRLFAALEQRLAFAR